jgi:2-keto-myo-inositol isomerase
MTVAKASYQTLLNTAGHCGCVGVEVRNDLVKQDLVQQDLVQQDLVQRDLVKQDLTNQELANQLFDGVSPAQAGQMARDAGLRILALAEVKAFNRFSDVVMEQVQSLAATATACGAAGISLIPSNDGAEAGANAPGAELMQALKEIKPVLAEHNLIGFIEPLGFRTASLRNKADAVEAIEAADGAGRFKIIHDTFHHYLAANDESNLCGDKAAFYPEHTGLVHISGVTDQQLQLHELADEHRVHVDGNDRLGNVQQLIALTEGGYDGPVSVEAFAPSVHNLADPTVQLMQSFKYLEAKTNAVTA